MPKVARVTSGTGDAAKRTTARSTAVGRRVGPPGSITGLAIWNLKALALPPPVSRTVITLPQVSRLEMINLPVLFHQRSSFSALCCIQGGTQQIYLRAMDSLEARLVPAPKERPRPSFRLMSMAGVFPRGNKLKKVS